MAEKLLHKQHHAHDGGSGDDPGLDGPSPLAAMVQGYGRVAREAKDDCARGTDATTELGRRANRSGQ